MGRRKRISQDTRNLKMKKRRREMAEDERESIRKEARERLKQRIATETIEEREVRLAKVREMVRLRRHNESATRREARLKRAREQQRARRAALETEEQREARRLRQQRRVQRLAAEHKKEKIRMERAENWREQIVHWQMNQAWQTRPQPTAIPQPIQVHHPPQALRQQLQPQQILANGMKPLLGDMFVPNGQFMQPQQLMFSAASAPRAAIPANPLHAYFALVGLRQQPRKPEMSNVKKIPGLPDVVLKSVNQEGMYAHFQEPMSINNGYFSSPPPWVGSMPSCGDDDSVDPLLNCEVVMKDQSDDDCESYETYSRNEEDDDDDDDDEDDFPESLSLSCQQEMTVGDPSTLSSIVSPSVSSEDLAEDSRKVEYPVQSKLEPIRVDTHHIDSVRNVKRPTENEKKKEFRIGDVTVIRPTENGSKKEVDLVRLKQEIEEEEEEDSLDFPERVGDVTVTRNGGSIKPKLEISKVKPLPLSLEHSLPPNPTRINSDKTSNKHQVDDNSISLTKILNNNSRYLDLSNVSQENLQRLRSIPACISISNTVSISATPSQ